jgi:hypothetical protein
MSILGEGYINGERSAAGTSAQAATNTSILHYIHANPLIEIIMKQFEKNEWLLIFGRRIVFLNHG